MPSFLDVKDGLYDNRKRFAFTNITDEPFTTKWDGVPVTIEPHETIEISITTPIPNAGHAFALKATQELVDKIMIGDVKRIETEFYKANPVMMANTYRAPNSLGIPAARKPIEDKIIRELGVDEESPAVAALKKQLLSEISAGANAQPASGDISKIEVPPSFDQFAQIRAANDQIVQPEEPKKRVYTKRIKVDEAA